MRLEMTLSQNFPSGTGQENVHKYAASRCLRHLEHLLLTMLVIVRKKGWGDVPQNF